jgi:hypothetical protein
MEVSGSIVPLPEGAVLGAAFYDESRTLFVQQVVLSTENAGLVIRFHRQLSSWNVKSRSVMTKRVWAKAPQGASTSPCGRIETSAKLHRVFLCSAESHVEVLDPDNLETVGTMARADDEYIRDIAVDDLHTRLLVLASMRDGSAHLAAYSLLNGEKQQETVLPAKNAKGMRLDLAVAPKTGQIGIAVQVNARSRDKADIYSCASDSNLACTRVTQVDAVSQITFLGSQLLTATNTAADTPKECVLAIDLVTRSVTRKYCSPATGVHYAVGAVGEKYVVAFTGVSKWRWFSQEDKAVSSSFSVWRAGTSSVAAVANDPTDYGTFQGEIRVVASPTEPLFIAYHRVSNMLRLYTITDHN